MIEIVNQTPFNWPEGIRIAVLNKNPIPTPPLRFNGKNYDFPPGEMVSITPEAAFFLFAVESRCKPGTSLVLKRDKNYGKRNEAELSYYEECMSRYGCANTREGRDWFANFDFAIEPIDVKRTAKDFQTLKAGKPLPVGPLVAEPA